MLLLLCMAGASHAFTTGRPVLSLTTGVHNKASNIPGRAPVDVFYVDDESSEEHTATAVLTPRRPQDFNGTPLMKELVLDVNLSTVTATTEETSEEQQVLLEAEQAARLASVAPQEPAPVVLTEKDIPAVPTMRDYRKFALPCFGLLLSGPLLSLVDTAFVGLASTHSMELAALGPATTLFDCLSWFLSFLNVATTNLYSTALAKGSQTEAEGVVRTGSRIGLTIGLGVMASLIIFCKPILAGYMGKFRRMTEIADVVLPSHRTNLASFLSFP